MGKAGEITQRLKALGKLDPEARRAQGAQINLAKQNIEALLEARRGEMAAAQLSHGQTQWLEIALILAQDPALILMDEPTAGMTGQETRKTAELFDRLRGAHTLIVVEHDMGFVRDIAETISVMHQGKLLAEGTLDEISSDPQVREAYLGSGGIGHA